MKLPRNVYSTAGRALLIAGVIALCGSTAALAQDYKESYNAAIEAAKAKNYTAAYQNYEKAAAGAKAAGDTDIAKKSSHVLAQLDKIFGVRAFNQDNYSEAITHFDKGIANNPAYAPNYYNKAMALKKMGRTDDAMAEFKKVTEMRGDAKTSRLATDAIRDHFHSEASRLVASEGATTANADRAIAELTKMQQFLEPNADSYFYMATAHNVKGDYSTAVDLADKALAAHKGGRADKAKIYYLKGEALMNAGNVTGAKEAFSQATYGNYRASAQHYLETL